MFVPDDEPESDAVPVTVSAPVPPLVIVTPLIDVAVAAPRVGVVKDGLSRNANVLRTPPVVIVP